MRPATDEGAVVRVFLNEDDRYRGARLYEAIVELARKMDLAGAIVFRGVEGFGASGVVHSSRMLRPTEDLPMMIEVADTRDRVGPFVDKIRGVLDEVAAGGYITVEAAQVIRSRPRPSVVELSR